MPNWTKEQESAIYEDGKNIIVSAGAGSGKTAVLTERVITKVKNGTNINELLILTFTNAAAHEMKERIRDALREANLDNQLEYIDNAYITTFDSYALSIVKKYHYLLNKPKHINIIDGTFIEVKKKDILENILENYYQKRDVNFLKLINDFCVKDDKEIFKCLLSLYNSLALKQNFGSFLDTYVKNFYSEEHINKTFNDYVSLLKEKINSIEHLLKQLSYLSFGDFYTSMLHALNLLLSSENYEEIKNNANIKLPILRDGEEKEKLIKNQINDYLKEIKNLTKESEDDLKKEYLSTKKYIEVIIQILKELNVKVRKYKDSINYYEFTDIALMSIDILKNNPHICEEIKQSYKEIMIDEYQDTNDLQEYFISLIANNNVYMVGDIKQSIYRFRNANPNLFKDKYNNYQKNNGGSKIDLNKNFRSRKEILNDINVIFNLIMDDFIGGAEYSVSHKMIFGNQLYEEVGKNKENNKLEIYNYNFSKEVKATRDEVEASIVAEDIKKKIEQKYLVFDKEEKILRPCKYKDFVILMDKTTAFDIYKKIFESQQIPLISLKEENILEEIEISLFKNFIKLINKIKEKNFDQEFKYTFVSLARSYLYNISDNDIYWYLENNKIYESPVYKDALELTYGLENTTALELLDNIVDKWDFFHKIIKTNNIEHKMIILDYLRNIFADLSNLGFNLKEICDYLEKVENDIGEIKIPKLAENQNAVQIMTIYKSKGLEFPICYETGLLNKFNIKELNSLFFFDNYYGIIPSIFKEGIDATYLKELAKHKYLKENISEKIRLFYVALTRCREKMIVLADLKDSDCELVKDIVSDEIRLKYKSFNDILFSIKENLAEYIKNIDLNKLNINYLQNKKLSLTELIDKQKIIEIKEVNIREEKEEKKHYSKEINKIISKEEYQNMQYGTLIHEILENFDFKNPNWENVPENLKDNIQKLLNFDIFKNIKNADIYSEYEFIYEEDNQEYHGIIDLLVIYDDHVDIIDYKLKNIDDKKYLDQLNGYKKFIEKLLKKDTNIYLYSILENILKKI